MKIFTLLALLVPFALLGCDSASPSRSESASSATSGEHLLTTRPVEPSSLTAAAEKLNGSEAVVLIGKIDAGDFPAFQDDQATFMLSELPADGHGGDDPEHADNCPFCKRRAEKAPKAIVNIVGEDGAILPTDARELLGVKHGDRVIVVGTASYDESVNAITLQCNGVYTGPW